MPMLAELSRMMATAEAAPPPNSDLRLVSVGLARPMAMSTSTATRSSISSTSWIRRRRRVFSTLIRKNRSVLNGKSFARWRLIMCRTTGITAARAANRNPMAPKVMACYAWQCTARA